MTEENKNKENVEDVAAKTSDKTKSVIPKDAEKKAASISKTFTALEVTACTTRIENVFLVPPFLIFKSNEALEEFHKQNPGYLATNAVVSPTHFDSFLAKYESAGTAVKIKFTVE